MFIVHVSNLKEESVSIGQVKYIFFGVKLQLFTYPSVKTCVLVEN